MAFSEAERASLEQIERNGLRLNDGRPCECGVDAVYSTRRERAFSDSMVYHHTCGTCGNRFSTWTEG